MGKPGPLVEKKGRRFLATPNHRKGGFSGQKLVESDLAIGLSEKVCPASSKEIGTGAALDGEIISIFDHQLIVAANHPEK